MRPLTPAELAEIYRDAESRAELAAASLSTAALINRHAAEHATYAPEDYPLVDDDMAAPDEAAAVLRQAADAAQYATTATAHAAEQLRQAQAHLAHLAPVDDPDADGPVLPRAVSAPILFNAWLEPRRSPGWVHEPTVEIWREAGGDLLWLITITEHPGAGTRGRLLPSQRPHARSMEDSTQIRVNVFAEGLAALSDPVMAWVWRDLTIRQPTTAAQVAQVLSLGGATDTTAGSAAAQGLAELHGTEY